LTAARTDDELMVIGRIPQLQRKDVQTVPNIEGVEDHRVYVLVTEAVSDRDQHTVFAFCEYSVKSIEHRRIWLLPAFVILVERRQYEFAVNVFRSPYDA